MAVRAVYIPPFAKRREGWGTRRFEVVRDDCSELSVRGVEDDYSGYGIEGLGGECDVEGGSGMG